MDVSLENENLVNEDVESQTNKSKSDTLAEMSEQEMSQHLSLCLKLAAENKINTKNAFGLHLIGIMRQWVRKDSPDLQFASLSLQASSKIYAGRVEALYKDTFAFHNQLQSIAFNKKDEREHADNAEGDDGGEERREKRRAAKSKQTYLTTEENVSIKSEISSVSTAPHANYITIKKAFTTSRTAPKLLDGLTFENDSSKLCCTKSSLCFYPRTSVVTKDFLYPEKKIALIKKVLNVKMNESASAMSNSDVFFEPDKKINNPAPELNQSLDDSFCIGATTPIRDEQDDVEDIIEKFSVLDITADLFTSDISQAIGNNNTVDKRLLPPNSALKRVLNTAERSRVPKTPLEKPKKEKPAKGPYFNKDRIADKAKVTKGRKIELSEASYSAWNLKDTANLHSGGHDRFSTVLAEHYDDYEDNEDKKEEAIKATYKLIHDKVQQNGGYFCKRVQLWNPRQCKQQITKARLVRPSSFGVCLRNENDSGEMSTSNCIIQSFQNLSIHNSVAGSDEDDACFAPDADNDFDSYSPEPVVTRMSRVSGLFEDDLKSVMVTPPELVQPVNVRYQTEPITLNTEKVKEALWNIVEKHDAIPLSDVHKKLEGIFENEKLPLQFAFAMLLLLANEKCLLLENISDGADVKISKDVNELAETC